MIKIGSNVSFFDLQAKTILLVDRKNFGLSRWQIFLFNWSEFLIKKKVNQEIQNKFAWYE